MVIHIKVEGKPAPGGSKNAFIIPNTRRVVVTDAGKGNKEWKSTVALAARRVCSEKLSGPLSVVAYIRMPRPKHHYRKDGTLKPTAPQYHTQKPDKTKLWRSTEDALTGIAWDDDAQVVQDSVRKDWGTTGGADIYIEELR